MRITRMLGVALLFLALTAYPAARANAYFAEDSFAPFWQQDVQATGTRPAPPAAPELTHRVASGETLWSLARYYHVDLVRLMAVNRISDPARLSVGQDLVIPGRTAQSAAPAGGHPAGGNTPAAPVVARGWNGFVTWPLLGELTQQFGPQADGSFHHGLDIAGNTGMTVRAAQRGLVIYAGWLPIYGFTVIIDHGSGFRTLYAHLHDFLVRVGDFVEQGQVIAHVGSSGNASGPHLHFEVRRNNQSVNPLPYLVGN